MQGTDYIILGKRYAKCADCGETWNVALKQKIRKGKYLCPRCRAKNKKKVKEDEG